MPIIKSAGVLHFVSELKHPKFSNGDHVRAEGVFETVHHQDRSIFYNQVEATKVVALPE